MNAKPNNCSKITFEILNGFLNSANTKPNAPLIFLFILKGLLALYVSESKAF